MKPLDKIILGVIVLATVAVVVGSRQTEPFIHAVTKLITSLISTITSPQQQG